MITTHPVSTEPAAVPKVFATAPDPLALGKVVTRPNAS